MPVMHRSCADVYHPSLPNTCAGRNCHDHAMASINDRPCGNELRDRPATRRLSRRRVVRRLAADLVSGMTTALTLPLPGLVRSRTIEPITIAAASDLKFALEMAEAQVLRPAGHVVRLVFGSSGNLTRQIQQGAPFDLFMSADEALVDRLADAGLTLDRGTIYGIGRLMMIAPAGPGKPPLSAELRPELLAAARIAVANPEFAPYGRAAQQALVSMGFADGLRSRWVVGESVAQATQFVLTGAAPLGFSALSLCLAPTIAPHLRTVQVPASWYAPLRQRMVMFRRSQTNTPEVYGLLQSAQVRELFAGFGLAPP